MPPHSAGHCCPPATCTQHKPRQRHKRLQLQLPPPPPACRVRTGDALRPAQRPRARARRLPTWFLSRVRVTNWFSTGGTFRRMLSTRRWRWMRTYLGHFTKRCRSRFGGGAPPRPAQEGEGRGGALGPSARPGAGAHGVQSG